MSSEKRLNFAIVGCGRIAQRHAEHIKRFGRLVATCDLDLERAATLAKEHDAHSFTHLEEMLAEKADEIDLVAVCTPNGLHAEHTIMAFEAGCHVLCEKPLAISVVECGQMIISSERANRRLFVVKQNRYNPPVQAVKELLDNGTLGRIFSVHLNCFWNRRESYYKESWKGSNTMDGGCLYTQFSHFIDLLYWMVGDVRAVTGLTNNYCHEKCVEFEDSGVFAVEFYNGAMGSIAFTVNSHKKNMEGSLTLFCEKGTVKIGGQYLNELEYQNIDGYHIDGLPEGRPANQYGHYQGSMSNHDLVYENVVSVL
ncbi:MAG: Gfo/Idh/MocA family oxidoreductase, partial [Magnetococcales bacterium]|nr:Gfo/Idh/MocA family oxidoreductase [Magnetococcales bacterium]